MAPAAATSSRLQPRAVGVVPSVSRKPEAKQIAPPAPRSASSPDHLDA